MLAALARNFTIIRTTASFQASVFFNVKLQTQTIYIPVSEIHRLVCTCLFIMICQIVGLHVAYNTILCKLIGKCIIILLAGTWHQICNINNRPVA